MGIKKTGFSVLLSVMFMLTACGNQESESASVMWISPTELKETEEPDNGEIPVSADGSLSGDMGDGEVSDSAAEMPEAAETGPEEVNITISAAGDVTMGNYRGQGYEVSFRQTYDQGVGDSYFFENVADIFSADDLTLVNLEGPLTRSEDGREEQTYCISGDPEYVNILTAGSVEAVSMGNNHRLDYKEQGTADTVDRKSVV